jgi:hypothetical protein
MTSLLVGTTTGTLSANFKIFHFTFAGRIPSSLHISDIHHLFQSKALPVRQGGHG